MVLLGRGTSTRRGKLAKALIDIVDKDTARQANPPTSTPSYAAVAATAAAPPTAAPRPSPPSSTSEHMAIAHAAAAQAAATYTDPQQAANAYVAALRGLNMMSFPCYLDINGYANLARTPRAVPPPPEGTATVNSFVDSMATFWIVESSKYLYTVTNSAPNFTINTANGAVPVEAVGIVPLHIPSRVGNTWECYEIPNVLVLPGCGATLYSTRVMKDCFNFNHMVDKGKIEVPGAHDIAVDDDGAAYSTPVAFVPAGTPRPKGIHIATRMPQLAALMGTAAYPAGVSGTPQAFLHHKLGYPYFKCAVEATPSTRRAARLSASSVAHFMDSSRPVASGQSSLRVS